MSSKVRIVALCMLLSCMILVSADISAATPVVVDVWGWRAEDMGFWEGPVQKAMDKIYPNIKVKYTHYQGTEYDSILSVAMQGGSGPDVMLLRRGAPLQKYAEAGALVALDDKVPELRAFTSTAQQVQYTGDGKVYGVPFAIQTLQVFYNKSIFKKFGLEIPKSWSEFISVCTKLKANGVTPIGVPGKEGWALSFVHYAIGASYLKEWTPKALKGEASLTSPQFVGVLDKMLSLRTFFQNNYSGFGYEDMRMMFATEQVAMVIDGIWSAKVFATSNPKLDMGIFLIPAETATADKGMFLYLDGSYGVNAKAKNMEAALALIRFTATKEFGQLFTDFTGECSAVPGVRVATNPVLAQAVGWAAQYGMPAIYSVGSPLDYGNPSIKSLFDSDLQGLLAGKISSTELAQRMQASLAAWYGPFQKK